MSAVTITLAERKFRLSCSEDSKRYVEQLAKSLDLELSERSKSNPSTSFEMLLVMTALGLMDERHSRTQGSTEEVSENDETANQIQLADLFDELRSVANKF